MTRVLELIAWLHGYSVLLMLLVFLLIYVSAYAPRRKARLQQHALIPLRDDH